MEPTRPSSLPALSHRSSEFVDAQDIGLRQMASPERMAHSSTPNPDNVPSSDDGEEPTPLPLPASLEHGSPRSSTVQQDSLRQTVSVDDLRNAPNHDRPFTAFEYEMYRLGQESLDRTRAYNNEYVYSTTISLPSQPSLHAFQPVASTPPYVPPYFLPSPEEYLRQQR